MLNTCFIEPRHHWCYLRSSQRNHHPAITSFWSLSTTAFHCSAPQFLMNRQIISMFAAQHWIPPKMVHYSFVILALCSKCINYDQMKATLNILPHFFMKFGCKSYVNVKPFTVRFLERLIMIVLWLIYTPLWNASNFGRTNCPFMASIYIPLAIISRSAWSQVLSSQHFNGK